MTRYNKPMTGSQAFGACVAVVLFLVLAGILLGGFLTFLVNTAFPGANVTLVQGIAGAFLLIIVSSFFRSASS